MAGVSPKPNLDHPSRLLGRRSKLWSTAHRSPLGQLYHGDCLPWLRAIRSESVDMVFADPPFNLGKDYGKGISDELASTHYLAWSREWLEECTRVLRPGGALFVFNLPQWLIEYGAFLNQQGLSFRHWIAMRMPKAFPRGQRMSPAHYGCLYYTKGSPKTFNRIYVPIPTCRHCNGEIRDYGGHRKALNEKGLNLMDVFDAPEEVWEDAAAPQPRGVGWTPAEEIWDDIPPVRQGRYKLRGANELAPLMLERLVAMATVEADIVLDPFGGSGTTFYAAEKLRRRWLGIELGDTAPAIRRLKDLAVGIQADWETARGPKQKSGSKRLQLHLLAAGE